MDFLENVITDVNPDIMDSDISTFSAVSNIIINTMLGGVIAISVIFMIISGIKFITSQGNPREIETARKSLTYSLVAFLLAVFSISIKYIVLHGIGVTDNEIVVSPNF